MPQYGKPTGRDTIENLLKRLDELENTVKRLGGSPHRSAMDRGDTASVADPIEGQTLVQYTDNTAHFYANGAWHTFATAAATTTEPPPFQPVPFYALQTSQFGGPIGDNTGFNGWKADTSAPGGRVFTNTMDAALSPRTPALNDYFTFPVTFGPKGSCWALCGTWKRQSNGGTFKVTIGNTTDTSGELADPSTVTFLNPFALGGSTYDDDTYKSTTAYDGVSSTFSQGFVVGGNDGDTFTSVTGTDPDTFMPIINGGSGTYRWKLQVTSKNASSSGYEIDLLEMAWVRLTALTVI